MHALFSVHVYLDNKALQQPVTWSRLRYTPMYHTVPVYRSWFAQQLTPTGNGSIIGIATAYSGANQMAIRNTGEVNMTGTGCGTVYHTKDFEDGSLTSLGWSAQSVLGTSNWAYGTFSTTKFAKQ